LRFLTIPPHKPTLPQKVDLRLSSGSTVRDRLWLDPTGSRLFAMDGYDGDYKMHSLDLTKLDPNGVPVGRVVFRSGDKYALINAIALDPAAGRFAAAVEQGADGKSYVECWPMGDKPAKTTISTPVRVESLAFVSAGKLLATGASDGSVAWYDAATGKSGKRIDLPGGFTVGSLAAHPGGKHLACGTYKQGGPNLFLVDVGSGEIVAQWLADVNGVTSVNFSPDGDRLATYGSEGIKIWDATALLKLQKD
jgi:WD40 repeat protein